MSGATMAARSDIDGSPPASGDQDRVAALASAVKMGQSTLYPVENPDGSLAFNQGLSWVQDPGNPTRHLAPIIFKDGGTSGFSTIIVVNPAKDLALFLAIGRTGVIPGPADGLGVAASRRHGARDAHPPIHRASPAETV